MLIYRFYITIIFDFVFNKSWCCNVSQNSLDQETFFCIVQFCWANWASVSCSYPAGVLSYQLDAAWLLSFELLQCDWLIQYLKLTRRWTSVPNKVTNDCIEVIFTTSVKKVLLLYVYVVYYTPCTSCELFKKHASDHT